MLEHCSLACKQQIQLIPKVFSFITTEISFARLRTLHYLSDTFCVIVLQDILFYCQCFSHLSALFSYMAVCVQFSKRQHGLCLKTADSTSGSPKKLFLKMRHDAFIVLNSNLKGTFLFCDCERHLSLTTSECRLVWITKSSAAGAFKEFPLLDTAHLLVCLVKF